MPFSDPECAIFPPPTLLLHPYSTLSEFARVPNRTTREQTFCDLPMGLTWDSYGRNAMLISVRVLMTLAARDFTSSLNSASGQAARMTTDSRFSCPTASSFQQLHTASGFFIRILKRQPDSSSHPKISTVSRV